MTESTNLDLCTVAGSANEAHHALNKLFGENGPIARLHKYVADLERENADSRDRIAALQRSCNQAEGKLIGSSNRTARLTSENAGLKEKLEVTEATMAAQVDRLVARIKDLEHKLTVTEKVNENLRLSLATAQTTTVAFHGAFTGRTDDKRPDDGAPEQPTVHVSPLSGNDMFNMENIKERISRAISFSNAQDPKGPSAPDVINVLRDALVASEQYHDDVMPKMVKRIREEGHRKARRAAERPSPLHSAAVVYMGIGSLSVPLCHLDYPMILGTAHSAIYQHGQGSSHEQQHSSWRQS